MLATVPGHRGDLKLGDTHISQVSPVPDPPQIAPSVPLAFILSSQSLWLGQHSFFPPSGTLWLRDGWEEEEDGPITLCQDPLHCPAPGVPATLVFMRGIRPGATCPASLRLEGCGKFQFLAESVKQL